MFQKVLLSSDEGYSAELKNGEPIEGTEIDLHNNPRVIKNTISFDNLAWKRLKGQFSCHIRRAITIYENRYKVPVSKIAMIGSIYSDNNEYFYGKMFPRNFNPLDIIKEFEFLEVIINQDDEIEIHFEQLVEGALYKGELKLYLISRTKLSRITGDGKFTNISKTDYSLIARDSVPVKYTKEKTFI